MVDRLDRGGGRTAEVDGDAVDGDDAEHLRHLVVQQGEMQISDRRRVQQPPQLPLAGLEGDFRGRIVRIGNGHEVDREIARGRTESGVVVRDIAIRVDHGFGHDGFGRRRRRSGIDEFLIADHEHTLGQARDFRNGALQALHDQRAGSAAHHLFGAEAMNVAGGTSTSPEARTRES